MDPTLFLVALLAAAAALGFLVWARHHAHHAARIGRPVSRLADARPGPVTLRGKVQGKDLVVSPVSERRCLYLRVAIHADSALGVGLGVRTDRGMLGGHHHHLGLDFNSHGEDYVHQLQADHLQLTDGQTEVEVELKDADIELVIDRKFHADASLWDDGEVMKLLRSFGVATGDAPSGKYRLTETLLEPGDEVVAVGTLGMDGAGKLRLSGSPDEPLLLTDVDPAELARSSRG
ncbi:MAG TPA: GIDE domain-containing protein, partial [Myxococcota bacterium]|nr:GIDE domain-containing protein [Myxococcota bacterium]